MARREWPLRYVCAHPGCNESATYRYATRRDLVESWERRVYGTNGWRCVRHSKPSEVLGPDNLVLETSFTSEQKDTGLYWGQFGFLHGPGFKAFCEDFPPGTRLIVTARIELP